MRPRHGILRSREFIMKDMYSFDLSVDGALATYAQVRGAYDAFFAELKVPVLAARASSGDMGGDLSHEYHLPASLGEDYIAHCSSCGFAANTEVIQVPAPPAQTAGTKSPLTVQSVRAWRGISQDRQTLVNVWYAAEAVDSATGRTVTMTDDDIDAHAVKEVVPDLDTSLDNPAAVWDSVLARLAQKAEDASETPTGKPQVLNLVDWRLRGAMQDRTAEIDVLLWPSESGGSNSISSLFKVQPATATDASNGGFNFAKVRTGDDCTQCGAHGTLQVDRAIELGHTFYLGTRYTAPTALDVTVQADDSGREGGGSIGGGGRITPLMGCYGLGISRILGAVADHRADRHGLNWPRAIAPYEVLVVAASPRSGKGSGSGGLTEAAEGVYDELTQSAALDVLLDDRANATLPYKLKDADLTGYPVVVVVGAAWRKSVGDAGGRDGDGVCEVQCRQLGVKEDVRLRDLRAFVTRLLEQL